jgi:hypothetical protein
MATLKRKKAVGSSGRATTKPSKALIERTPTGKVSHDVPASGAGEVIDAGTGEPISDKLQQVIQAVKDAHNDAIHHATSIVVSASRAGEGLSKAKEMLGEDTNFSKWVDNNCGFKWRTAYDYVRVYEGMQRHAIDVTACTSIRQVLKLISSAEGKDPKDKDPKVDSFVTHAVAIERFFEGEIERLPIDQWNEEVRATRRSVLKNIASIYRKLS